MASIDFNALRQLITLEATVNVVRGFSQALHPNYSRGPCLIGQHNDLKACSYAWGRNLWYCHRCKQGGGPLRLYGKVIGQTPYQAAIELCLALGIKVPYLPRCKERKPRAPRVRTRHLAEGTGDAVDS